MITKIMLIAVLSIVLSNTIKEIKPEYSIYITIASSITMLSIIINELKPIYDSLNNTALNYLFDDELLKSITKICLIGFLKNFIINICLDYGYKTIAGKVDFAARITMVSLCIPWIEKFLVNIKKLL